MIPYSTLKYEPRRQQFVGDFKITRLEIDGHDVSDLMIQLDVYESLYGPMTGDLTLRDAVGFIYSNPTTGRPLLGGEVVKIEVDGVAYTFRIYKVKKRQNINPSSLLYTLGLISEDGYKDIYTYISKAYNLKKYEEVIEDIFRTHMQSDTRIIVHSPTESRECLVIPTQSALEACSWLASRAKSLYPDYQKANYLFFETHEGWHFVPYEMLLDSNTNVTYADVGFDTLRTTSERKVSFDKRTEEDLVTMDSYQIKKTFDLIENTLFGMYGSELTNLDIVRKKEEVFTWDYVRDFHKTKHMSDKPGMVFGLHTDHLPYRRQNVAVVIDHPGLFTNELPTKTKPKDWLLSRRALRQQGEFFVVEGVLGGNSEVRVGMALNIKLPVVSPEGLQMGKIDEFYSGRYVIKSLRRTWVTGAAAYITFEASKDSLEQVMTGFYGV